MCYVSFFFNDSATTEIYTYSHTRSLHDALPICASGQSFAIYRVPPASADGKGELRYAYFSYFEPWDWIFAVSDNARDVSNQFDRRRDEMETAVREALVSLRLADTGFAFIVQDDGELVSPMPQQYARLLKQQDQGSR